MPAVVAKWLAANRDAWGSSYKRNAETVAGSISAGFADFRPGEVRTTDCAEYLAQYRDRPPTHNLHRTILRQILSHAALLGLREGHNPVNDVPTITVQGRSRIVSDAEIEALRSYRCKGTAGTVLARVIDLALITGQRIGDVRLMRWQDVTDAGLLVRQGKTGARLCIEWSPALRAAVAACDTGGGRIGFLLKTSSGGGYSYAGIHSMWVRACAAAGIEDLHIHDLRGRAGVDVLESDGLEAARALLGHKTQGMTAHYTRNKSVPRVKPSR
jgi:integrase